MNQKEKGESRSSPLLIVISAIYSIGAIYNLAFQAVASSSLAHLYLLAGLSVLSALLVIRKKPLSLWVASATTPLLVTEFTAALNYTVNISGFWPSVAGGLLNFSLLIYVILIVLGNLALVSMRGVMMKRREPAKEE